MLAQEEGPDEILIYDDCSSVPPSGLPKSSRLRVLRGEENRGPAYGRNALLNACNSDYVHFHDSDDLIFPGWARRIRQEIAQSGADVLLCDLVVERDGVRVGQGQGFERLVQTGDLLEKAISDGILVPTGVFRADLLRRMGGYPAYWQSEDYAFYIQLALQRPSFTIIPEALNIIRQRPDGRAWRHCEVSRDTLRILEDLRGQIPSRYYPLAGERAFRQARVLFLNGDRKGAIAGFKVAKRFDPRPYRGQFWHYVLVADLFGPWVAEYVGLLFRRAIRREKAGNANRTA